MNSPVLVLTNSLTGLYNFRKEVIRSIVDGGYSVTICCPYIQHDAIDYFTQLGCSLNYVDVDKRGTNPLHDLKLISTYRKTIKNICPLAVLTYSIKPNIYGGIAARISRVPQLANITGLGDALENPGILKTITIRLYRIGLRKAKTVFYQNQAIQDFCKRNRIGKTGVLLPGSGVNTSYHTFQPYPQENETIKFLYMGRFMKDKGTDELLEAIRAIHKTYPNRVSFILLGSRYPDNDYSYEKQIGELQRLGALEWPGVVWDVRPYLKDSWCTIHPSYHEGMANVILESCAAGRPVITNNISGCKEAVWDGKNGFLCTPRDSKELIEKIEQFIKLPYADKVKMGLESRRIVEESFDRNIVCDAYLTQLKQISSKNV